MSWGFDDISCGGQLQVGTGIVPAIKQGDEKINGSMHAEGPVVFGGPTEFPDNFATLMIGRTKNDDKDCVPAKRSVYVKGNTVLEGDDERRNIDNLMTKLRSIAEETNVAMLLVSHLRRAQGDNGHENGREVSLSHLRGSQSIAQLSDAVVAMERDQQSDDPNIANTTTIRVLKNRYAGDTGVASHFFFNKDTGRLTEVHNLGDDPEGDSSDKEL